MNVNIDQTIGDGGGPVRIAVPDRQFQGVGPALADHGDTFAQSVAQFRLIYRGRSPAWDQAGEQARTVEGGVCSEVQARHGQPDDQRRGQAVHLRLNGAVIKDPLLESCMGVVLFGGVQDHRGRGYIAPGQQGPGDEHCGDHGSKTNEKSQNAFAPGGGEIGPPDVSARCRPEGSRFCEGRFGGICHEAFLSDLAIAYRRLRMTPEVSRKTR